MNNPNHPPKGSTIRVDPIRETSSILAIKQLLQDNPRDLALFTIGINTNLRASDLLRIKVLQVHNLKPNDSFLITEKKTRKNRVVTLNECCVGVVRRLIIEKKLQYDDFLFKSQKGDVLTVGSVHRLVKSWCREIGLKGNFGSHTLRKTWGYHQRVTFGVDLPRLMVCFNHSSQRQTLDYLGIQPEEIREIFMNNL